MMESLLKKYAKLLVNYCVELKEGEKLFLSTTTLAEPLVREIFREALRIGGHVEVDFKFREQSKLFLDLASKEVLSSEPVLYSEAIKNFDAYINIRAPFNLNETSNVKPEARKLRSQAMGDLSKIYFERTADRKLPGALKRSLCQYPTQASAQAANMSLEEYQQFVFNACHLYSENPEGEWLKIRKSQQKIKEYLDGVKSIRYKADHTDVSFSVDGRTWINSDGQTNMPSGEVFSGPVENSVNGKVHFGTIFELPFLSVWLSVTINRFAPEAKSIAPPTPKSGFPGTAQFAKSPFSSICNPPIMATSICLPRIMAKLSALSK